MEESFNFLWAYWFYRHYVDDMLILAPHESKVNITFKFWQYEKQFYIPPEDAFQSILRKIGQGRPLQGPPIESKVMEEDIPNELR